ncbi:UDP-N-acetylmuramoyl-tripeptide--D-alanyl-D-alanine ligase [Terribacillus halophilus]|jgi:UDP-N-acetylmuramoyl-tripeptide--D-alanyl-D-alanine ligase|uniref:UDP-N-acetylmuramoyl-tripeptide--D-alanyl-D- alanine ligase n=1 Tax=Terribacillus halophilus TaxID=361279 RepID=UPI000985B8F4|nr:UDP-N-acetylmuramoyl-tripeptide--D-alanyl-D-alanine ligase [Terribacillus halophilus]
MLFSSEFLYSLFPDATKQQEFAISQVNTDSRKDAPGSLFVPIRGERFDAHNFIEQAIAQGASAALWDRSVPVPQAASAIVLFLVDDTLEALQKLAQAHREAVDPIVVGITGSNGKTTTKDLVTSVLNEKYEVLATKGNFNNHIGLPLTVLSMQPSCEVLVLEMGMSNFGEIELLSRIAQPDYAIITNIGESHIEFLGSREGIAKAKSEITAGMGETSILIIDGDESLLDFHHGKENTVTCGFGEQNTEKLVIEQTGDSATVFSVNGESYSFSLLGAHNVRNAGYAIVLGTQLGVSKDQIQLALQAPAMTGMRMEQLEGKNGSKIINDAYNASPTSMKAAIQTVQELPFETKILVLGDIYEIGAESKRYHREIADVITAKSAYVFTIGEDAEEISAAITDQSIQSAHFSDKASLAEALLPLLQEDTIVLLKASRGMKLESILDTIGIMKEN